jgi:decaprenylphospho-beta-D-ribofuranose 2-oxidase
VSESNFELPVTQTRRAGFGGYRFANQSVYRPERLHDVIVLPKKSKDATILACGFGNSYGDAALNESGLVVTMERLNRMLELDPTSALLRAEAGVSVLEVMRAITPFGLTLAATPGFSRITLGGCAAFDIHSQSHWHSGGFGDSILKMTVLLADGSVVECSRVNHKELFYATVGGMGLTGIILELEIALQRLPGMTAVRKSIPFQGVECMLETLQSSKPQATHLVAWIDLLNKRQPEGYVIASRFEDDQRSIDLDYLWRKRNVPPLGLVAPYFNKFSNKAFNLAFALKHRHQPASKMDIRSFLFPWDAWANWNRLYGTKGFVEYQCCIPLASAETALTNILAHVIRYRQKFPTYLAVAKCLRDGVGMLSFPINGISILLDFPVTHGIWRFLDQLDQMIIDAGGRVYLAKDGRVRPSALARMYPRLEEWKGVRKSLDPENLMGSDMGRRLNLLDA